jgi:hypothetical protein
MVFHGKNIPENFDYSGGVFLKPCLDQDYFICTTLGREAMGKRHKKGSLYRKDIGDLCLGHHFIL